MTNKRPKNEPAKRPREEPTQLDDHKRLKEEVEVHKRLKRPREEDDHLPSPKKLKPATAKRKRSPPMHITAEEWAPYQSPPFKLKPAISPLRPRPSPITLADRLTNIVVYKGNTYFHVYLNDLPRGRNAVDAVIKQYQIAKKEHPSLVVWLHVYSSKHLGPLDVDYLTRTLFVLPTPFPHRLETYDRPELWGAWIDRFRQPLSPQERAAAVWWFPQGVNVRDHIINFVFVPSDNAEFDFENTMTQVVRDPDTGAITTVSGLAV